MSTYGPTVGLGQGGACQFACPGVRALGGMSLYQLFPYDLRAICQLFAYHSTICSLFVHYSSAVGPIFIDPCLLGTPDADLLGRSGGAEPPQDAMIPHISSYIMI